MSNDIDTIQTSAESNVQTTNQAVSPESNAPEPTPPPIHMESVALGAQYLWNFFEALIFIFLAELGFVLILLTLGTFCAEAINFKSVGVLSEFVIIIWLILGIIAALMCFRSMRCFWRTPKEIHPHAPLSIVLTWSLATVGALLADLQPLASESFQNKIAILILLASFYSCFCLWSYLNILGENVLPSKKGCKGSIVFLLLSFIAYAVYLFGYSKGKLIPDNNGWIPFGIAALLFLISVIALILYSEKLRKHFTQLFNVPELKKEDSRKHMLLDIAITLGAAILILFYFTSSLGLLLSYYD